MTPVTVTTETKLSQMRQGDTLTRRLLLTVLPTVLVPLMIASGVSYLITQRRASEQAQTSLEQQAQLTSRASAAFADEVFGIVNAVSADLLVLASLGVDSTLPPQISEQTTFVPAVNAYLSTIAQQNDFLNLFFTDRRGRVIAYSQRPPELEVSDEDWWQRTAQGRPSDPEFEVDEVTGESTVTFVVAISDPESGAFLGVMRAELLGTALDQAIVGYVDATLGESFALQIVDTDFGRVIETVTAAGVIRGEQAVIGGETILEAAETLGEAAEGDEDEDEEEEGEITADLDEDESEAEALELSGETADPDEESGEVEATDELQAIGVGAPDAATLLFFDSDDYAVRVFTQGGQQVMNLYNRQSEVLELSAIPVEQETEAEAIRYSVRSETSTYLARVTPTGAAELEIVAPDGSVLAEEAGENVFVGPPGETEADESESESTEVISAMDPEADDQEEAEADLDLPAIQQAILQVGLDEVSLIEFEVAGAQALEAGFGFQGKQYQLGTVPGTDWITIASLDEVEIAAAGQELALAFGLTGLSLGVVAMAVIVLLARQLSRPLQTLTRTTEQVARGNFDITAPLQGPQETQVLAQGFNDLVAQVRDLLQQQTQLAEEQREQRQQLEQEISQLMNEVGSAIDGDLTVRATLTAGDVGIVADLINSIIENLRDIALGVKQSTGKVRTSLTTNQDSILSLAEQAISEAERIQQTLQSVENMSQSIQIVASNASQAAQIADFTYSSAQESSAEMERMVSSIQTLRTTVGETAKKMKRLGESSQKISQVVSLIDEIALKTNLLAINASVEASRAGELGQGFTAVAEQVGSLAEQASTATQEIAQLVDAIQLETQEVAEDMEIGTAQVVETTREVEAAKQQLDAMVQRAQQINQLMQSISQSTTSQATISKDVAGVMQQVSHDSLQRSALSRQVASAMQSTTQVAQDLQTTVEQFKVDQEQEANPLAGSIRR